MRISILSGGTGGIKLLQGFLRIMDQENIFVIANVADNMFLDYGYFAPDVDTALYAAANILSEKYYGVKNDTYNTREMLLKYGYEEFLEIGDKDRASHIFKISMLKKGYKLCEIIKFQAKALNVKCEILPPTDEHIESRIVTDMGDLHIQEFWVKYKGKPNVFKFYIKNLENAKPCEKALDAIENSDVIIIGPSNPISSIYPILKILDNYVKKYKYKCIAISPIIKNKPISGPAEKYMKVMGLDVNNVSLAKFYKDFISYFVIDSTEDEGVVNSIEKLGIKVFKRNIIMKNERDKIELAKFVLEIFRK